MMTNSICEYHLWYSSSNLYKTYSHVMKQSCIESISSIAGVAHSIIGIDNSYYS